MRHLLWVYYTDDHYIYAAILHYTSGWIAFAFAFLQGLQAVTTQFSVISNKVNSVTYVRLHGVAGPHISCTWEELSLTNLCHDSFSGVAVEGWQWFVCQILPARELILGVKGMNKTFETFPLNSTKWHHILCNAACHNIIFEVLPPWTATCFGMWPVDLKHSLQIASLTFRGWPSSSGTKPKYPHTPDIHLGFATRSSTLSDMSFLDSNLSWDTVVSYLKV